VKIEMEERALEPLGVDVRLASALRIYQKFAMAKAEHRKAMSPHRFSGQRTTSKTAWSPKPGGQVWTKELCQLALEKEEQFRLFSSSLFQVSSRRFLKLK
jgi:hypothetical protein